MGFFYLRRPLFLFTFSLTFFVVDDGLETLVLKSKGVWPSKEMGEKVDVTFYLFRVGP